MADNGNYNWKNEKFLIADDDIYSFLLLEKVLKNTGAVITHAHDGREALQKLLKDKSITVAILDIVMPFMSGFEIIAKCKPLMPDTLFIAFTADIVRSDKQTCKEAGFALCIAKPILPVKFLKSLEEVLSLRGQLTAD